MLSSKSSCGHLWVTVVILLCQTILIQAVGETYNDRCDIGTTQDHRTVDTCDREKFLACKEGRCLCQDLANQIWTYRTVKVSSSSRSKRSPKKGGGKKIIAAAAAGAAGGYIASHAIRGSSGSSSSKSKEKTMHLYGCYSRVKGQCVLDSSLVGGDVIVAINKQPDNPTTTTTTTTSSSSTTTTVTPVIGNSTTTIPGAPIALAQTSQYTYDVTRIPKCVEHAECTPPQVKIVDGKVVSDISHDPRLGVCACKKGYKATSADICEKSGAFRFDTSLFLLLLLPILTGNLISKSFLL